MLLLFCHRLRTIDEMIDIDTTCDSFFLIVIIFALSIFSWFLRLVMCNVLELGRNIRTKLRG